MAEDLDLLCACAAVRRAARSVTQLYDLVLSPSPLKVTEFLALKIIHDAGEIAQCDFARDHAIAVETLSRRLASLRKKGLVTSRLGTNHERLYTLTVSGEQVYMEGLPHWLRAQARLKHSIGATEWSLLFRMCERAVEAAKSAEELRTSNVA